MIDALPDIVFAYMLDDVIVELLIFVMFPIAVVSVLIVPNPEYNDELHVIVVAVNPANVEAPITFKVVASVVAPVV